jgi:hypothetical protein
VGTGVSARPFGKAEMGKFRRFAAETGRDACRPEGRHALNIRFIYCHEYIFDCSAKAELYLSALLRRMVSKETRSEYRKSMIRWHEHRQVNDLPNSHSYQMVFRRSLASPTMWRRCVVPFPVQSVYGFFTGNSPRLDNSYFSYQTSRDRQET